ncbi:MAG: hypothetical protein EOO73_11740 [Myxococcales bacterium]|nr:MAG: hypothetical protein EOO73_11740 [Myxococcales bacterium]
MKLLSNTRLVVATARLGWVTLACGVMACEPAADPSSNDSGHGGTAAPAEAGSGGVGAIGGAGGGAPSATGGTPGGAVGGTSSAGSGGNVEVNGGTTGGDVGTGDAGNGGEGQGASSPVIPPPLEPALMSRCTGTRPIRCSIPVSANGNYHVTVELGSAQAASSSRVEAELARVVVPTIELAAGEFSQHTFSVNVRDEIHDDYTYPGKQLDVSIDGDAPALRGLGYAAADIPTLFVAGDSTVCDSDPVRPERGWAQELSMYLKPGLAVANYADAGDTAGSLYSKFAKRGALLKKGDYLFIQFGHNDMKSAADTASYKANVMKFVADARSALATPVLFSPVARRAYLDDRSKPTTLADPGFNGLDQQARDLAASEHLAFVDLTTLAIQYYATVDAPALFSSRTEIAHFNTKGATAISQLVVDALKAGTTPATSIADFLK